MGRKRKQRCSSYGAPPKKKKTVTNSGTRFVWAIIPGTPVKWPVEIVGQEMGKLAVYIKSDNAILKVKPEKVEPFPGENFELMKNQYLDSLKKKGMRQTCMAFQLDWDWALELTLHEAEAETLQEAEAETLQEAEAETLHEAEAQTLHEAEAEALQEAEAETLQEAEAETLQEAEAQTLHEAEAQTLHEAEAETLQEAEAETLQEAEAETLQEAEAETLQEAESKTLQEAEAQTLHEAEAETLQEAESKTLQEAEAQTLQEAEAETLQEAEAQTLQEAESKTLQEAEAQTLQEAEAQTLQEAEAETLQEAEAETLQEAEAKTLNKAEAETPQEAEAETLQEADTIQSPVAGSSRQYDYNIFIEYENNNALQTDHSESGSEEISGNVNPTYETTEADDSDWVNESSSDDDSELRVCPIVIPSNVLLEKGCNIVRERDIIRDVSVPGIYVRKLRKSSSASKAQAKTKKSGNFRVYDNFHACLYCGEMRQHMKTHMRVHRNIPEVQTVLKSESPDFTKLRKQGDHKHNKAVLKEGVGELVLARRPDKVFDISQYGPCLNCKEWMVLRNIKRHLSVCTNNAVKLKKREVIIMSQVEGGLISTKPSKMMLNEVFPSMYADDVAEVAKKDQLIIALGESWLRRNVSNREKRRYYCSQHMRLMAKLLIALRDIDGDGQCQNFSVYLNPRHFDKLVAAALECCFPFMDDLEELRSPSNGIKIKYDLRRMLTARWAMLVKNDPQSTEAKEVQTCLELLSIEWAERVNRLAHAVMVRRTFSMKKELPAPEDIQKLTRYIASELRSIPLTVFNFSRIVQLVQTRLMTYNRRRSGEIDGIKLLSYAAKTRNLDELDQSLVGELTKVEKHLLNTQDLMKVRGKGNRPVPVLVPDEARKPLDYISSRSARREAEIPDENDYLFPVSGLNHARAYTSLKKTCNECTLVAPSRITSVSMRKYTATLTQMLNLDKYQMDWLCRHLGHTGDVHKTHYRQMSDFIERVHLTKLFLLQDNNMTQRFKGKTLEEIDVTDIVFPGTSNDRDEDINQNRDNDANILDAVDQGFLIRERDDQAVDPIVFDQPSDEEEDERIDEVEISEELRPRKNNKQKAKRQHWDKVEVEEIHKYFKEYLNSKICPRGAQVEAAKKASKQKNGKIWLRSNDKIIKKISAMNHK